jgi:hypothetical protein
MKKFTSEEIVEMCQKMRKECNKMTRAQRDKSIKEGMEIIDGKKK